MALGTVCLPQRRHFCGTRDFFLVNLEAVDVTLF